MNNLVDKIIAYESGELGDDETIALFQHLRGHRPGMATARPIRTHGNPAHRGRASNQAGGKVKFEGEDIWAGIRPTHADFQRLTEVVNWIEDQKLAGRNPNEVYAEFMDNASVAYLAVNRCKMDLPRDRMVFSQRDMLDAASNEWMEGFIFGLLFEKKGGHQ